MSPAFAVTWDGLKRNASVTVMVTVLELAAALPVTGVDSVDEQPAAASRTPTRARCRFTAGCSVLRRMWIDRTESQTEMPPETNQRHVHDLDSSRHAGTCRPHGRRGAGSPPGHPRTPQCGAVRRRLVRH